jgi:hypothetical protein
MKGSPMNAEDDVITGLDGPLLVMIELPINALQLTGGFVFLRQGIIQSQIKGAGRIAIVAFEISNDEFKQGQTQVVGIPRADAEEVGQVAGIDAWQFEGGELGQGFAAWGHDEEIGKAFDMLALGVGQRQSQEADKGDNRCGTLYDSFHGGSVVKAGGRFGDHLPF